MLLLRAALLCAGDHLQHHRAQGTPSDEAEEELKQPENDFVHEAQKAGGADAHHCDNLVLLLSHPVQSGEPVVGVCTRQKVECVWIGELLESVVVCQDNVLYQLHHQPNCLQPGVDAVPELLPPRRALQRHLVRCARVSHVDADNTYQSSQPCQPAEWLRCVWVVVFLRVPCVARVSRLTRIAQHSPRLDQHKKHQCCGSQGTEFPLVSSVSRKKEDAHVLFGTQFSF